MIAEAIKKVVNKQDLTYDEARSVMDEIMSGNASQVQEAAYLTALSMKGETIDEITASAEGMRAAGTKLLNDMDVLEIVGTGGDKAHSFNISTTSAMVIASSGVKVAKHGNRAASSQCGTADCLEALGVNINEDPKKALEMLEKTGFAFLFAQKYHSAMKYVGPIRKELGIRTVFNISTTASIVIAADDIPVAKHGNRAASSRSGAADCLEALGVKIDIDPARNLEILKKINICFLFAQRYHSAMRFVGPVRKELGIRTIFNILGPLTSPAGAAYQVMGVYDESLVEPLAKVLSNLGVKRGMVVYGLDSLDEISMSSPTAVCEINGDRKGIYRISPEDFGYKTCDKKELLGGRPEENARITRDILSGADKGPKRQAVCLNAGAAIYIAGKAGNMKEGVRRAEELIDSGKAGDKLSQFIDESNK